MNTGQGATERENHIYHWMSWAIYDYNNTGTVVAPESAWNIENGEPNDDVSSAPVKVSSLLSIQISFLVH